MINIIKKIVFVILSLSFAFNLYANVVPIGRDNNRLYYKIGGGSDYALPPVATSETIHFTSETDLGLGLSCSAFNPGLSISNTLNNLKQSAENLTGEIIANATAAIIMLPEYELAKRNPSLYALLNGKILSAYQKLTVSTKNCSMIRSEIARGQNPYQDWGTIAVNDQWQKNLSLTSEGKADINDVDQDIDAHSGEEGVTWVTGKSDQSGHLHAGGVGDQPPIHVIADTVKAGYNTLLGRDLQSDASAPSSELAKSFPTPESAMDWTTRVIGDQIITTCHASSCKPQGTMVGQGLLPLVTNCQNKDDNCVDAIKDHLGKLVTGNEAITHDNLERVSADGIAVSPDAISAISRMDSVQKNIIVNKLAEEIALQRMIDKAFLAKHLLATGAQIPIIYANKPAQNTIHRGMETLDNDIRSLTFESQIRKQMVSNTLSEVLDYSNQQANKAQSVSASSNQPMMENGALVVEGKSS